MSLVKTILTKIGFNNGSQPALNDTNLNQMQTNIQTAISSLETNIEDEINDRTADSGWQMLTLTDNFMPYKNVAEFNPMCRKVGQLVEVTGIISPVSEISSNLSITIATLLEGYRPSISRYYICQGSDRNIWMLTIDENGKLIFSRYGTSSYPVNTRLSFNAIFLID